MSSITFSRREAEPRDAPIPRSADYFANRDARWARWARVNGFDPRTFYPVMHDGEIFDHGFTVKRNDELKCVVGDGYNVRPGDPRLAQWVANGFNLIVIEPGFWCPPATTAYLFACADPWPAYLWLKKQLPNWHGHTYSPFLGVNGKTTAEFRKRLRREKIQWLKDALAENRRRGRAMLGREA
jgi:hypothetical protein